MLFGPMLPSKRKILYPMSCFCTKYPFTQVKCSQNVATAKYRQESTSLLLLFSFVASCTVGSIVCVFRLLCLHIRPSVCLFRTYVRSLSVCAIIFLWHWSNFLLVHFVQFRADFLLAAASQILDNNKILRISNTFTVFRFKKKKAMRMHVCDCVCVLCHCCCSCFCFLFYVFGFCSVSSSSSSFFSYTVSIDVFGFRF